MMLISSVFGLLSLITFVLIFVFLYLTVIEGTKYDRNNNLHDIYLMLVIGNIILFTIFIFIAGVSSNM